MGLFNYLIAFYKRNKKMVKKNEFMIFCIWMFNVYQLSYNTNFINVIRA